MEDLSLHILDIVENSTAAGASLVEIGITENPREDLLVISIKDNGRGMDPQMLAGARDPFVTTRTTRRVGLGLPLLDQAARETGGRLEVDSAPGRGTSITATFQGSHIDRKPLGDLAATMISLILGNPEVDFVFESNAGGVQCSLDTREIRKELGEIPITTPAVLALIRKSLTGGEEGAHTDARDEGRNDGQAQG
ncbi:MAG: ATP-binding protein [Candidatus Eisenbacteria sp.]|nr:ATP-binding protein [Candidatus Eisenbacteria bacterium]